MENEDQSKLLKLVNTSGFPFQIAVANQIEKTKHHHGWRVFSSENPWENQETGRGGYVDLILINHYETQLMVLECKRVKDAKWVFLISDRNQLKRRHAKVWVSYQTPNNNHFGWGDIALDPPSPEAEFCVIRGQDKDNKPMLERVASELIEATESIAMEDFKIRSFNNDFKSLRLYCPVIITTAEIQACIIDPNADINIKNGEVSKAEFETVPLVRFRKSLTTKSSKHGALPSLSRTVKEKERTVFVINASNLAKILKEWDVNSGPWRGLQ